MTMQTFRDVSKFSGVNTAIVVLILNVQISTSIKVTGWCGIDTVFTSPFERTEGSHYKISMVFHRFDFEDFLSNFEDVLNKPKSVTIVGLQKLCWQVDPRVSMTIWETRGMIQAELCQNSSKPPVGGFPHKPVQDVPFFRVSFFIINSWTGYGNRPKPSLFFEFDCCRKTRPGLMRV